MCECAQLGGMTQQGWPGEACPDKIKIVVPSRIMHCSVMEVVSLI